VNLGFNEGASLPDPDGILRGTGSHVRHVSVRSVVEAGADWIDVYVAAAMAQRGASVQGGMGGTTVRSSAGPKRRPTPPP
jgi:hypothetical protein